MISIHALLAESDSQGVLLQFPNTDFYPRSPCGERLGGFGDKSDNKNFYPRSPCGERPAGVLYCHLIPNFYPRSPCGERRQIKQTCRAEISISIHALLAESDLNCSLNGFAMR